MITDGPGGPIPMRETAGLSEKIYRGLLAIYPAGHRRDYGPLMTQAFRDLCRAARRDGSYGIARLWLHTLFDLSATAGAEHYDEFRRSMMGRTFEKLNLEPRSSIGMLIAAVLIAVGVLGGAAVRLGGGSPWVTAAILILANLMAAVVMELAVRANGWIVVSTIILIAGHLLPTLWEPDPGQWLRENPINAFWLLILSLWARPRCAWWVMPVTAFVLGAIQVAVSLLL